MYGLPVIQIFGILVLIFLVFDVCSGRLKLLNTGTDFMFYGFLFSIVLSQVFSGWMGGIVSVVQKMIPVVVGYLIVRSALDSRKALLSFISVLICITGFIGYEGWRQYTVGESHGGMTPYVAGFTEAEMSENVPQITRIRWYGVFNDPNDLALVLVIVVPFLIDRILKKRFMLPIAILPPIMTALYLTNSRGGMLACATGVASFFVIRYRNKWGAIVAIILAVILLVFGPSRMGGFSSEDESANGRLESWYQGYQMFMDHPLFGVSMNSYTDYNDLTAHNSFVLVLAELGLIGAFFYTGMFYFPLKWLALRMKDPLVCEQENWGYVSAAYGSLVALMTAMFFLSRSYNQLPYLVLAIVNAFVLWFGDILLEELLLSTRDVKLIIFILLGEIAGIYAVIKFSL